MKSPHPICRTLATALLLSIVLLSLTARPQRALANAAADQLHAQAKKAFKEEHDYVKARRLWEKALKIHTHPKYLYNLATMSKKIDRPAQALRYYVRFIVAAESVPKYKKFIPVATRRIAELIKLVGTLKLVVPQAGAKVHVDQRSMGVGPISKRIYLRPGAHLVSVMLDEHHGQTRTLFLKAGEQRELVVHLKKIIVKTRIVAKKGKLVHPVPRWLPWTAMALGIVVAGGGGVLTWQSQEKYNDYDDSVSIGSPNQTFKDQGDTFRNAGIALFVVGGVIAATGLIGIFLNKARFVPDKDQGDGKGKAKRSTAPSWLVMPLAGPRFGGIGVLGRF